MENSQIAGNIELVGNEIDSLVDRLTPIDESNPDLVLEQYKRIRVTDSTQIEPPIELIRINGELISTNGNLTTISGASKSGKSAFTSILIAGAMANGSYDGLDGLDIAPARGGAVIQVDTEQALHKHKTNLISILRRAGLAGCPENFFSYNFRDLGIDQYRDTLERICSAANSKFGRIHMVVLDGGADFIQDVNDIVQSNELVRWFEHLAIQFTTTVILVVHTNPNGDKERGHIGSQLQRKSESILTIKSDGDVSYLEPKLLRMAGKGKIPLLQFAWDTAKCYHVGCGVRDPQAKSEKSRMSLPSLENLAKEAFAPPRAVTYDPAIEILKKMTGKGNNACTDLFKKMKESNLIIKGDDKNWRLNMEYGIGLPGQITG
jgi:hypothetical protein